MHGAWNSCYPNSICKVNLCITLMKGVELKALESYTTYLKTEPLQASSGKVRTTSEYLWAHLKIVENSTRNIVVVIFTAKTAKKAKNHRGRPALPSHLPRMFKENLDIFPEKNQNSTTCSWLLLSLRDKRGTERAWSRHGFRYVHPACSVLCCH